jgi:hypothetical protein
LFQLFQFLHDLVVAHMRLLTASEACTQSHILKLRNPFKIRRPVVILSMVLVMADV